MKFADLSCDYRKFYKEIQERKQQFLNTKTDKKKVFKELCFCLLTPQSKATSCWVAVEELFKAGYPDIDINQIEAILRPKVRFYRNKAKYLVELAKKFNLIYKIINNKFEPKVLREILINEIKGLGMKEASHFLRNIGYSFDLAILDRHILENLKRLKIIKNIPKSLTKRIYFEVEDKFLAFSKKIKISLVDLDLLFWAKQTGFVFK
ncbi:MAG: N-glycosylase/DNA lyase [Endomicrobia bacterium]|nr:N-glycosylase/DNA lyase [Endomicrobiia bacterium]MDW8055716.1 N-glycosylase/DNA lyase [Elusimicrobiota bacterium]